MESQDTLLRRVTLLAWLAAAWLLWSGIYKPLLIGLGAFSCLLTLWLVRRMGYFEREFYALQFSLKLLRYWIWLAREIVRSSLEVARIVLDPKLPITPRVIDLKADNTHYFEQVVLGNSITLTPGTLTLDVHEGVIKVHSLTEGGARDLVGGNMKNRVNHLRDWVED